MNITEMRVSVVPVRIKAYCDRCGIELGEAIPMPSSILQGNDMIVHSKKMYMYTCPKCGESIISESLYPHMEYLETQ